MKKLLIHFFILLLTLSASTQAGENKSKLDSYAAKLGYSSVERLKEEYEEFSKRVKAGFAPKDYFTVCRKTYNQSLCDVLREHLSPLPNSKKSSRKSNKSLPPIRIKNTAKLQALPIRHLARRFPNLSKKTLEKWSSIALKSDKCPKNLNIVLALEIEQKTPEKWEEIDGLWESGLKCLPENEKAAEYAYLRASFSQIARGKLEKALEYLDAALKVKEKDEDYRVHYWKYIVLRRLGKEKEARDQLETIGKLFPVSWYWISSAFLGELDPLEQLKGRKIIDDVEDAKDPLTNLYVYWTKVSSELEKEPNDLRIFFEKTALRTTEENNIGLSQHLAKLFNEMKLYRFQIFVLSKVILNDPEKLNFEHLQLLFPRPFFENMKQHSGAIDTAILLGLARQESGFDIYARSSANARGLLQLLHSTARGIKHRVKSSDLYNYDLNIELGAAYIKRLVDRFDGSLERSLAAYNAGSTHMRRWAERYSWVKDEQLFLEFIPFRETRDYVPSILRNAYWYHRLFPSLDEESGDKFISGQLLEPLLQKAKTKPKKEN